MSSQYPTVLAGQRMTADIYASMLPSSSWKVANTTITSTTLTADPDLSIPLVANGIYEVEMWLFYAGSDAGNFQTAWQTPSGATGNRQVLGPSSNAVNASADQITGRFGVHGFGTAVTYSCARNSTGGFQGCIERGLIIMGSTAGSVTLEWAQATSNATGTLVAAGSYMTARRLA